MLYIKLQTLDKEEQYSDDELAEYEKMAAEQEAQQWGGHAQPGLIVSKGQ